MSLDNPSIKMRSEWEKELGVEISEEVWKSALLRINGSSSCARLNLVQCKVHYLTVSISVI